MGHLFCFCLTAKRVASKIALKLLLLLLQELYAPVWALRMRKLLVLMLLVNCCVQDMNREIVKTDCATVRIPELDFEIPAFTQKGGGYVACAPLHASVV